jgi:spermidine synthase
MNTTAMKVHSTKNKNKKRVVEVGGGGGGTGVLAALNLE